MNKFREFMVGRYGVDTLTFVLFALYFVLQSILRLSVGGYVYLVAYIPLVFAIYRVLSKDIETRRKENACFLRVIGRISTSFKSVSTNFSDHQKYKYFRCPNCGQKLRVPRGAGKIRVTCQRCGRSFDKKIK